MNTSRPLGTQDNISNMLNDFKFQKTNKSYVIGKLKPTPSAGK